MKPPEHRELECIYCGREQLSLPLLRLHVLNCAKSPRPRGEANRKRLVVPTATVEGLFGIDEGHPMNKVMLVGNLGHDPSLRQTDNGKDVCSFSLATNEKVKRGTGYEIVTTWHHVLLEDKQAKAAKQSLRKGTKVFVEGRIQVRAYQGKDGTQKTAYEIVASRFEMLDGAEGDLP